MRQRLIALLDRVGTALLVMGLTLFLVSLIPPAPSGFSASLGFPPLMAKGYSISPYSGVYSPQSGIQLSVDSNNTLQLYLIGVSHLQLEDWAMDWVKEQFPNETDILPRMYNISVFEAYLLERPESVLLEETVEGNWSCDFFPTKVTNITIVASNPSTRTVQVDIEMKGITTMAARERVLTPAQWLISLGIVFTLPWDYMKIRRILAR